MEHSEFDAAFAKLAEGYREGTYEGRRFSLIVRRSGGRLREGAESYAKALASDILR